MNAFTAAAADVDDGDCNNNDSSHLDSAATSKERTGRWYKYEYFMYAYNC